MFENILVNLDLFFQDHRKRDRWSVRFDASNVNRRCSSRNRVGDHISRANVACFTANGTHVNMVSTLENVLSKPLGVELQMLL